jgi:hypothetical protein
MPGQGHLLLLLAQVRPELRLALARVGQLILELGQPVRELLGSVAFPQQLLRQDAAVGVVRVVADRLARTLTMTNLLGTIWRFVRNFLAFCQELSNTSLKNFLAGFFRHFLVLFKNFLAFIAFFFYFKETTILYLDGFELTFHAETMPLDHASGLSIFFIYLKF